MTVPIAVLFYISMDEELSTVKRFQELSRSQVSEHECLRIGRMLQFRTSAMFILLKITCVYNGFRSSEPSFMQNGY
jgi:hypothetical protein